MLRAEASQELINRLKKWPSSNLDIDAELVLKLFSVIEVSGQSDCHHQVMCDRSFARTSMVARTRRLDILLTFQREETI